MRSKGLILERIATAPAEFTLHSWNPEKNLQIGGTWMANGTVGSAPHIVGLDGIRRTGDRVGFDDLLKLAHMLNSIHFVGGYPVEPVDIHASVRHIHAAFDVLTLTDKHIHCYSLGRQKNIDCIEMARIARGVDDAIRSDRDLTVINSNLATGPTRIWPSSSRWFEPTRRDKPFTLSVHGASHAAGAAASRIEALPNRALPIVGRSAFVSEVSRRMSTCSPGHPRSVLPSMCARR